MRLALHSRGSDIDFKFVEAMDATQSFHAAGLMGERQPAATWLNRKFALDIDGFSSPWDNLFHRMLFGCCVLKIDSQMGFRQWYYDKLVPFETHVPIKADLSDLFEQVDWVRAHPKEAREIAANGQALARSMTFDSETKWAGQEIERIWEASK